MGSTWDDFTADLERARRECGVRAALALVPSAARATVEQALVSTALTATSVHEALRRRLGDQAPSPFSIRHHRQGRCSCDRKEKA